MKLYTTETLKKVYNALLALFNYFMSLPFELLKLHISKGNKKIGRVHNFSLAPILSCINCGKCVWLCYDVKACLQYANVRIARAENLAMMRKDMERTFNLIDKYISTRKARKYFRWHVSGDILSVEYFSMMVEIARRHPDWRFWTYTKAYSYVNTYCDIYGHESIPENLSVMFSVWKGLPCINPYGFATFSCKEEGVEIPADACLCPGNCETCLENHTGCPYQKNMYCLPH